MIILSSNFSDYRLFYENFPRNENNWRNLQQSKLNGRFIIQQVSDTIQTNIDFNRHATRCENNPRDNKSIDRGEHIIAVLANNKKTTKKQKD